MNTSNIDPVIEDIYGRFKTAGIEVDRNKIRSNLDRLVGYKVPLNEASRTVMTILRKEYNVPFEAFKPGSAGLVSIASIKEDNKWITVKGKVLQLWDPTSPSISQTGLIGDDTGVIRLTIFAKSADKLAITLEEGESYEFRNVVSSIWQDQLSLKANSNSEIVPLDVDIEVKRQSATVTGIITAISAGSGLIKRCPECKRKLTRGSCAEHGRVEGVFDLRLKAVLQDSVPNNPPQSHDLVINAGLVEKLTGIGLKKAIDLASEALDAGVVSDYLSEKVLFRYYKVTGAQLSSNFLVDEILPVNGLAKQIAIETKKLISGIAGGV
ncbi:MAG TPA: replication factor A [candidate division Zixibacteria bacterium]|nr:replication factor A [candidate division Zixibacteria bacterium]